MGPQAATSSASSGVTHTRAARTMPRGMLPQRVCCTRCVTGTRERIWPLTIGLLCGGGPRPTWMPRQTPSAVTAWMEPMLVASLLALWSARWTRTTSVWACKIKVLFWDSKRSQPPRRRSARSYATAILIAGLSLWRLIRAICFPSASLLQRLGLVRGFLWIQQLRTKTREHATSTRARVLSVKLWWGPRRVCTRWTQVS
mmetsp:Transcript_112984/g.258776  ORF Transcript_112984/g.258776 Transcript_112984/m.258776 type:complete len:200 (+) Transcript_112984:1236-1835(+)